MHPSGVPSWYPGVPRLVSSVRLISQTSFQIQELEESKITLTASSAGCLDIVCVPGCYTYLLGVCIT